MYSSYTDCHDPVWQDDALELMICLGTPGAFRRPSKTCFLQCIFSLWRFYMGAQGAQQSVKRPAPACYCYSCKPRVLPRAVPGALAADPAGNYTEVDQPWASLPFSAHLQRHVLNHSCHCTYL